MKGLRRNSKGGKRKDKLLSNNSVMKGRLLNNNSVMKGLHSNKGRKWKDLHLSSSDQRRKWNSEEWNAGAMPEAVEVCSKVQMIIVSVEADLEEGMVKKIVPM